MTHQLLRTDIMRQELIRVVQEAATDLTACVWSPFRGPRPERPYAEWRPITQPSAQGSIHGTTQTLKITRQADVVVLSAVDGQPYRVSFNYSSASTTATGVSTVTTVRDALVSAINSDREPVTAAAVSTDTIRLTGDVDGALWRVDAPIGLFTVDPTVGSAVDVVELQRSTLRMTASLNIYSADVDTLGESALFAHQVDTAFRSRRVTEELGQNFLAVTKIAEPVNLDGIPPSGTSFESRTTVDFSIGLPFWVGQSIEPIESVVGVVNTDAGDANINVSI